MGEENQQLFESDPERFLAKAEEKPGESGKGPFPLPSWVKAEEVREGQKFVRDNFFSVFFAHFVSLVFLLAYAPVRQLLVLTKKSDDGRKALIRYLSTLVHIKIWYEGDLLTNNAVALQDVYRIRKIHSGVARSVQRHKNPPNTEQPPDENLNVQTTKYNCRSNCGDGEELLNRIKEDIEHVPFLESRNGDGGRRCWPISQLDMAVTQFCFMGFVSLFPFHFGMNAKDNEKTKKGLEGFIHLWALIGHILGIEDECNICLEQNAHMREEILSRVLLRDFKKSSSETRMLWESLVNGIGTFIPFLRLRALVLFCERRILGVPGQNVGKLLNFYEKFCYALMNATFNYLPHLSILRWFLNRLLRLAIIFANFRYLYSWKRKSPKLLVDTV